MFLLGVKCGVVRVEEGERKSVCVEMDDGGESLRVEEEEDV